MKAIPDICRRRAELSPDAVAFEEIATGRSFTFAEVEANAARGAAMLHAKGLAEGDRVAVLCHNGATFFELLFACAKARLVLVPLNWRQTPAELTPILADCRARLLVSDEANADLAAAFPDVPALSFADYEAARAAMPLPPAASGICSTPRARPASPRR
jgi:fatty-acyl-CoA synthase